jgi:hypothetical protein
MSRKTERPHRRLFLVNPPWRPKRRHWYRNLPRFVPSTEVDLSTYRVGPEDMLEISVWREDA